jgi:8-oxo-dGTP pyrophosphatase MutT (NUDIX family)
MEENPWKTISTEVVYKNSWIQVREDRVLRPDGKPGIYGVVESRIATGVVALNTAGEITLVGQYRYPTEMYSWEIPEGGTEEGEAPLVCIQRELQEEAGIVASDWVQLGGEVHLSNCHSSEIGYVYLARELTFGASLPDATEVLQTRQVPFEDCVEMVHAGEIVDSVSIIAILRAERFLMKHNK